MKVSVRELEEYYFCPYEFYLWKVLGVEKFRDPRFDAAKRSLEGVGSKLRLLFPGVDLKANVRVEGKEVLGVVDFVVAGKFPIEVKWSSQPARWWVLGAKTYACLLRTKLAYLYLQKSRKLLRLEIFDEDRDYISWCVQDALRILEGSKVPRKLEARCELCDLRSLCEE